MSCLFLGLLGLTACGSSASGTTTGASSGASSSSGMPENHDPPGIPGCTRSQMEADFSLGSPLAGPGVDASGKLMPLPSGAYMSTTFLALKLDDASHKRFVQLMTPVLGVLQTTPGLLAATFGTSTKCATARTITVWQDEASMVKFSIGPEHSAAAAGISEISRGGSNITTWATTNAADASWDAATKQLADDTGPFL